MHEHLAAPQLPQLRIRDGCCCLATCMWHNAATHRQPSLPCCAQVTIQLAGPNVRCNVSVAAGALSAAAGEPTAASNTLSLLWDLEGPQVRGWWELEEAWLRHDC